MKKEKTRAFKKDVFLLGKDHDDIYYWLESEEWQCNWYWGCGYVETYTNNKEPRHSTDINSHQHFDSIFFKGPSHGFDNWKNFFMESVLTDDELWQLMELFKTVYTLKEAAEVLGRGGSHYGKNACKELLTDKEYTKKINEVLLPALFLEIKKILTPGE